MENTKSLWNVLMMRTRQSMDILKRLHIYLLFKLILIHSMGMFYLFSREKVKYRSSKTLLEMGRVEESIMKHKAEIQIAKKSGIDEIKIRAMDNLAVRLFI